MFQYKMNSCRRMIVSFVWMAWLMTAFACLDASASQNGKEPELENYIKQLVKMRNNVLISGEAELLEAIYDADTTFGLWALEHEITKMKYIRSWEKKQGIRFEGIDPTTVVKWLKRNGDSVSTYFICSTGYRYKYVNDTKVNTCRIGTEHSIRLEKKDGMWRIVKEWYKDPFADSMNSSIENDQEITGFIMAQQQRAMDGISERRKKAAAYADKFCGIASEEKYGFRYNGKYRNFNPLGGDCANFGSQILHEGGGFKKTAAWNYRGGTGSRAWLNADGFKNYMLRSGRASVIAHGSYRNVFQASYKLLPGDFVAYEKKGDVVHISVVTGADSKGYSLVSCHNTDRNQVPWDLGWNDKHIRFWLVRMHF